MKRYIKCTEENSIVKIAVIVEIEIPTSPTQVAAGTRTGQELPKGELLPSEKDVLISSQALEDYHSFIESVEDLISDYYGLDIYYKNDLPDNSWYFGFIAKNSDGTPVIDFEATIRVSNHPSHRSPESQANKQKQKAALKEYVGDIKLKPIRKTILVNKDQFASYEEAYDAVDQLVEGVNKVLTRKQK